MIDFSDLTKTVSESISNLINVTGHVDRNIKSYDSIRDRFLRRRLLRRLQDILASLTEFRGYNRPTLMLLAELVAEDKSTEHFPYEVGDPCDPSFSNFLTALLSLQDVLEDYHQDIIRVDYKLYENLSDSITARIAIVKILQDTDPNGLSHEKLKILHEMYLALVKNLELYKKQVQELIRTEGDGLKQGSQSKSDPKQSD